jgi:hypothetical protein
VPSDADHFRCLAEHKLTLHTNSEHYMVHFCRRQALCYCPSGVHRRSLAVLLRRSFPIVTRTLLGGLLLIWPTLAPGAQQQPSSLHEIRTRENQNSQVEWLFTQSPFARTIAQTRREILTFTYGNDACASLKLTGRSCGIFKQGFYASPCTEPFGECLRGNVVLSFFQWYVFTFPGTNRFWICFVYATRRL